MFLNSSFDQRNIALKEFFGAHARHDAFDSPGAEGYNHSLGFPSRRIESKEEQQSKLPKSLQIETVEKWMSEVHLDSLNERCQMVSGKGYRQLRMDSSSKDTEDSSEEEFFEAETNFSVHEASKDVSLKSFVDCCESVYSNYATNDFSYEVVPQIRVPLAPYNAKLDFSPIELQRGLTNIYTATPLARVSEFNCSPNFEECSILSILEDEFERSQHKEPEKKLSIWKTMKYLTVGANADEFDRMYPWAKYSINGDE